MDDKPSAEPAQLHVVLPPSRSGLGAERASTVPLSRAPLIGREQEVAAVRALLLRDDVPLVTLTGPGGVGKTRLAVQVAADVAGEFADGVVFVPLDLLHDPALVLPTIARIFEVGDEGSRPLAERLVAHLHPRQLLLVLDNLEQVIEAAPRIANLLTACPHLTVLATSRVVLRLSNEQSVPVAPLAVPSEANQPTPEEATAFAAVRLFVARARAMSPGFVLSEQNAAAVAATCRRLDGLPLALELAAARIPSLPPVALLARLEQALPLLTAGARDQPDRLRTMRDAIAWSYDLLSPAEQALFRRLAVFVGGFDLDGAEAVAGDTGRRQATDEIGVGVAEGGARGNDPFYRGPAPPHRPITVLDGVASLVEKSLLREVGGPIAEEPRYRMLETIREFGLEQLAASGEESEVRGAHAVWARDLVEHLSERVWIPGYERVLARLDADHDNVRAALVWADTVGAANLGVRLARATLNYWVVRGHFREGLGRLERALGQKASTPTPARARALVGVGWLATIQGRFDRAESSLTEALRIAVDVEDRMSEATVRDALALFELHRGHYEQAAAWIEGALELYRECESTSIAGPQYVSNAYARMGQIALARGDISGASIYLEEALRQRRDQGFIWGLSDTLRSLGDLARDQGDLDGAMARYAESVTTAREHGDRFLFANAFSGIASVAAVRGQAERAARLYGAAAALRGELGVPDEGQEVPTHDGGEAQVRSALSPEAFASARTAGAALSLADAIAEALAEAELAGAPDVATPARDPAAAAGLTVREGQVLRLLAQGLPDRDIAAALFISPRTASAHVSHLLAKLGVESRSAAVAFAVRHGLV
jgi:predicted ATPase/DNA-binding CsgD family transcriptional regulator